MTELELFLRLLLAIGLGCLIGIEREKFAKKRDKYVFGGIRTFALIALLGAVSSIFAIEQNNWALILSFSALTVFLAVSYYHSVNFSNGKGIGITGEIAALLTFLAGYLVFTEHVLLTVAFAILTTAFLYSREKLHALLRKISEQEVYSTLVFALIALVILPFLPDQAYGPFSVFNPHQIWLMVVLFCAIGYVGYFLMKIFGSKKGIVLTGVLGGIVSSTAVTMTMASKSRTEKDANVRNMLVFGTLLANTVMFVRVAIIVFIVNKTLLFALWPALLVMTIVGLIAVGIIWVSTARTKTVMKVEHKSPFSISTAVKFGLLFAIVLFLLKLAQTYFGNTGVYIASILSGFADVDAVTLSMSTIAGSSIIASIAAIAIILAVASNTIIKLGYSYIFGSKEFARKLAITMLIMVVLGLLTAFLL
ncbi:MAG: MgtC/SapB family protein [archaeon]